jgi:hypothetical protein
MQHNQQSTVQKLSQHPRWKSNYLPKVEKTAANRAIARLCAKSANDNPASFLDLALTAWHRHSGNVAVFGLSALAAVLAIGHLL